MASELSFSAQLNYAKSSAALSTQCNVTQDVTGVKYCDLIQNIGTTDEVISFGDIGTVGVYMLQNIDPTNYVDIGFNGSTYQIRLAAVSGAPGGLMIAYNQGATIHARANTAAANIIVRAVEA